MVVDRNISRIKLAFYITFTGDSSVKIRPFIVDYKIHDSQSAVLYICNDGYIFEKKTNELKYSNYRLILPAYLMVGTMALYQTIKFENDTQRYQYLLKLKNNFEEFTKSGFFGQNPYSHIEMNDNYWYVY